MTYIHAGKKNPMKNKNLPSVDNLPSVLQQQARGPICEPWHH